MRRSTGGIDPKAIIILVLVVLGCVVFFNYKKTGQWSLFPEERTEKEQKLFNVERELEKVNKQLKKIESSMANATATGDDIWYQEKKTLSEKKIELEEQLRQAQAMVLKEQQELGKVPQ